MYSLVGEPDVRFIIDTAAESFLASPVWPSLEGFLAFFCELTCARRAVPRTHINTRVIAMANLFRSHRSEAGARPPRNCFFDILGLQTHLIRDRVRISFGDLTCPVRWLDDRIRRNECETQGYHSGPGTRIYDPQFADLRRSLWSSCVYTGEPRKTARCEKKYFRVYSRQRNEQTVV
jgi:hypothetical protein